ncbi:response regulator transcription factor [Nocardioides agariphilus]|uniref:Response regulator transcription factor n=1 Tax=Nocardioides agariphilus TaxID=433664 RepID=A0A930VL58_9ACTN|nr:response regulator transcription factor [Nocardioides agariphilus]MBF4768738.1 response regulator transcription factor [Nocardioides agariphilus]
MASASMRREGEPTASRPRGAPIASLVVCDDHRLLVEALAVSLVKEGFVVDAVTRRPGEALAAVARHRPDILLTALRFPTGDAFDTARRVVEDHPETRVVILTASAAPDDILTAERLGVAGYIRKDERLDAIVAVLRHVADGHRHFDKGLLRRLASESGPPARSGLLDRLTTQERVVLSCLSDGLSTSDMVERLGISSTTVRSHIQAILSKLGVHSRIQAVAVLAEEQGTSRPKAVGQ